MWPSSNSPPPTFYVHCKHPNNNTLIQSEVMYLTTVHVHSQYQLTVYVSAKSCNLDNAWFTKHNVYSLCKHTLGLIVKCGWWCNKLAIIFILAAKKYKKFVYRLTLYLIVVSLLKAVITIPDVLPVYHNGAVVAVRSGFEGFCSAVGFLLVVILWMELLVICWIVLLDCSVPCYGASVQVQC